MNYLSMSAGRNRVSANVGYNTGTKKWSSKFLGRRKYYLPEMLDKRPVYVTASVMNPLQPERVTGVSASCRGYSLQARRYNDTNTIGFSKRLWWSPLTITQRKSLMENWKTYYEQEESVVFPPPPTFERTLPPDMRFQSSNVSQTTYFYPKLDCIGLDSIHFKHYLSNIQSVSVLY